HTGSVAAAEPAFVVDVPHVVGSIRSDIGGTLNGDTRPVATTDHQPLSLQHGGDGAHRGPLHLAILLTQLDAQFPGSPSPAVARCHNGSFPLWAHLVGRMVRRAPDIIQSRQALLVVALQPLVDGLAGD